MSLMEGDYVRVQRREKHSMPVDPNNKHWANDKSKFGYKMLLKMGWSEGKGLGNQEQGMTEHIVQNKLEERVGLGATVDTSSNWLENTSAYSQLLSSLRNKFNTSPSIEEASGEKEEAVKPKCVIFAKRARAKSIRTKSKQDLAAILGVKPSEVSSDEEIPGSTDSDSESRKEKKTNKRKAEIEEPVEELNIEIEAEEQEKKKKKKKKSKRKQETEQEEEQVVLATPAEEEVESKKDKKKKKSKKHREVAQEEAVVEEVQAEPVAELSEKKKKKKSKKHREEAVQEEEVVAEVQAEHEVETSEKKKKKKKKNRDE